VTELDKISTRPEHNDNYIYSEYNGETIILDGCFTRDQLLELALAMDGQSLDPRPYSISYSVDPTQFEPLGGPPVVYTEEMAAEDDKLLANVPTTLSSIANTCLTEAHVEDFLSNYQTREDALRLLQEMGQVDEHGNLTHPYQPVPEFDGGPVFDSGIKTRSLKDYANLHTEQILAIKEWIDAKLDWIELEEVYLEAASFDALFMSETDRPRDSLNTSQND
jgi:hypothetical protein